MIGGKIVITTDPLPVVRNLKMSMQKRGIKRAIKAAIVPVKAKVVSNAQGIQRYGFYAKTVGLKIKAYKSTVVGIVGARSKTQYTKGKYVKGKKKGEPRIIKPAKYAALVEFKYKRNVVGDAMASTSRQYLTNVNQLIAVEIERELAKKVK